MFSDGILRGVPEGDPEPIWKKFPNKSWKQFLKQSQKKLLEESCYNLEVIPSYIPGRIPEETRAVISKTKILKEYQKIFVCCFSSP